MVIKNAKVITPEKILEGFDVLIENGFIKKIKKNIRSADKIDACGMLLTPGFVDIHTHGGYEADFMDCTDEAFEAALSFHLDNGTTSILPTSCTAPTESILSFINFTRNYMKAGKLRDVVIGAHLEGPYLSVRNRGAQKLEELKVPKENDYSYIIVNADVIKNVTISPELSGAAKMAEDLSRVGILTSGGHDDGIYPEFLPAIESGLSHLTHHYCAMSELRFKDGKRNVGLREWGLVDDRLTLELIADNRHIPPELARLIVKAKGADKICVVSDSLRCAGQPKDERLYKLGSDENAQLVKIGDSVATTADGEKYAGSITPVRKMVKNLIDAGIPLIDAVKMGTLTPAKIIGIEKSVGSVEVGKRANLCILDESFNAHRVFLDGKEIKASEMNQKGASNGNKS